MRSLIYRLPASILPNPTPVQPPGTEGVNTFLNYLAWGGIIAGFIGFLVSCILLAVAAFGHGTQRGFQGIAISLFVCILVTATGAIMQAFV